jgi:hypothetical protein
VTTIPYTLQNNQYIEDILKPKKLFEYPRQNSECTFNFTGTKSQALTVHTLGIARQMDENICLVEFLDRNKEPLNTGSFISRGSLQGLAEIIIGNGLAVGSWYITVIRNRKSGQAVFKSHDMQLMRHLLSGLCILETTLLDYIIIGDGTICSASEAGILENKWQRSIA